MGFCRYGYECSYFNEELGRDTDLTTPLKGRFCLNNPESCAIYRIRTELGAGMVPEDLQPFEWERADELLAGDSVPFV